MKQELTGTIKALLDEYKKAINELIAVIEPLSREEILIIKDDKTTNDSCRSIQTILSHVVHGGYGYTNFIENHYGNKKERRPKYFFEEHPNIPLEEYDPSKKILMHWGQLYDIDQLMEHAIVHILKHRRQIQRFVSLQPVQS